MSYYYAKIKHDFFQSDEMRLLGSRGCVYQMVYLKLILMAVPNNGRLEMNGVAYDMQALSSLTQTPVVEIEEVIEFLKKYQMITLDGETIVMSGMDKFVGGTSTKRVREYRERQKAKDKAKDVTQKDVSCNVTSNADDVSCNNDENVTCNGYKNIYNRIKNIDNRIKRIDNTPPDWAVRDAHLIVSLHQEIDPLFKVDDRTVNRWAQDIDKIHRLDGRPIDQIEQVIVFAKKHEFWSKNIISGDKLRKQFPRLVAEMTKRQPKEDTPIDYQDSPLDLYYAGKITRAEMVRRVYGEEDYQIFIKYQQDEDERRRDELRRDSAAAQTSAL